MVSESELEAYGTARVNSYVVHWDDEASSLEQVKAEEMLDLAEATCRAREVRFIGAADQGSSLMLRGEVKE